MLGFLEKLKSRKVEIERTTATSWQTLIISVADGKETDADQTLTTLDWLKKTPDDLASAIALLGQRREWQKLIAAGAAAEVEHPLLKKKIAAEVAAFADLEAKHDAKLRPLHGTERAAVQAMSEGSRAKTELLRTATDPVALQAVAAADVKLAELRRERQEHDHRLTDKSDALRQYKTRGQSSDYTQIERLEIEVAILQRESKAFVDRAEKLNAESAAALAMLLSPEAI